jgi:asparagine synthase (glutamine-hydrolysing)
MCGIAGIANLNGQPVDQQSLAAMTEAVRHRGPDGQGLHIDGCFGLGHRRLSIIDLAGGAQPMSNEDGRLWVTYNGEIYNYAELQKELESAGHRFKSRCDTEVIVHAYEEWGAQCVERFRGMFAFAVYDARRKEVFLARDRLGIKPLVYSREPGRIAFASELQALEQLAGLDLRLNLDALDQYLQLGYIPAPASIYENVFKLPPGHTMTITGTGKIIGPQRYWDVQFEADERTTEQEWLDQLDDTIREAVRLRLRADVPFGAFLSGGVDSSLVVAYMAKLLQEPVRTFSIGFEEMDHSELPYARQAAQRCRTNHHEQTLRPNALEILPELVRHYGEPFGDSSAVPTYYVSQLARRHVKMVLSGDGGDENFGGYFQYLVAAGHQRERRTFKASVRHAMGNAARAVGILPRLSPLDLWTKTVALTSPGHRRALFRRGSIPVTRVPRSLRNHFKRGRQLNLVSWFQYFDLKSYLPYDILTKVDIASMYHGLEVRVPLLDHQVVQLAARIPARFKVRRIGETQFEGKIIFRKLAGRYYDKEFLNRKKMGFAIPLQHWFRDCPTRELLARLYDSGSRLTDFFDRDALEAVVNRLQEHSLYSTRLWLLLFLAEWFRQHPRVAMP